jgi:GAF domain-containing protein
VYQDYGRRFADIARDLASQPDPDAVAARIVEQIVAVVGCPWTAMLRLNSDGSLRFAARSAAGPLDRLERIVAETGEGPAPAVLLGGDRVLVEDVDGERRWPVWRRRVLAETPVRSALGFPLYLEGAPLGAITMYAPEPRFFTADCVEIAAVYADHAAVALSRVSDRVAAENLRAALRTNREIAMAIGILMNAHRLTKDQAFDLLRVASQHRHRKLHDLADEVVLTGQLPGWPVTPDADCPSARRGSTRPAERPRR